VSAAELMAAEPQPRRVVIVDTETTGLDEDNDRAVEVGWLGWRSPGSGLFVPPHSIEHAHPEALAKNRYHERALAAEPRDYTYAATRQLHGLLLGATLAGANPRYDARMLAHLFRDAGLTPVQPWHHRLLDVQAYAGGILGFPPWALPSLLTLTQVLGLPEPTHGAWDDAVAVARVLDLVWNPPLSEAVPGGA
jgi:DNA polymerase-3 subunit epsilon